VVIFDRSSRLCLPADVRFSNQPIRVKRFRNSKAVGAVLGLTPCKYQSGESDRTGGISRCGDEMMRVMFYEAAQILLTRSAKWSWLKDLQKVSKNAQGEYVTVCPDRPAVWD